MKNLFKLLVGIPFLTLACGDVNLKFADIPDAGIPVDFNTGSTEDAVCATTEDTDLHLPPPTNGEIGQSRQALTHYDLGFYRYASAGTRTRGELFEMIECAIERIRAATCLQHIKMDTFGPNFVRWQYADELAPNTAIAVAPWSDSRIQISNSNNHDAAGKCTLLVHEMFHVLRRSGSHPGEDGSLSFPVTHLNSQPKSRITASDIADVCDTQDGCGCSNPEPPIP